MPALILDSGALIAIERGDRHVGAILHEAASAGIDALTSTACLAEVWRDPARQARLARALRGIVEVPLDSNAARGCGMLLARMRASDIADAAVALIVRHADTVLTSDPDDIRTLLASAAVTAGVHRV